MVYDIPLNATGLDTAYSGLSDILPIIFPLILFFEFCVIMITGTLTNQRKTGYSNIFLWMVIASVVTTLSAVMLNLAGALVPPSVIIICVSITVGSFLLYSLITTEEQG